MFAILILAMMTIGCSTGGAPVDQAPIQLTRAEQAAAATTLPNDEVLDESLELSIGAAAEPRFLQENGGEVDSQAVRDYVSKIGLKLAAVGERPKLPWAFHVLDSSEVNAFALPGGRIFITRGLLAYITNEAQLAGVLGHECGHVNSRHMNLNMLRSRALQLKSSQGGIASHTSTEEWLMCLGIGSMTGSGAYLIQFSRDEESAADASGVVYMARAGYSPYGQIQILNLLRTIAGNESLAINATHPLFATRIDLIYALIFNDYPRASDFHAYQFNEVPYMQNVILPLLKLPPARNHRVLRPAGLEKK